MHVLPIGEKAVTLIAVALLGVATAQAEDSFSAQWSLDFEVAADEGGWQKTDFIISGELRAEMGSAGTLTAIPRLRFDPVNNIDVENEPSPARGGGSRRVFLGEAGDFELRELYLDTYFDEVFLRLGKQQIVWGQADGLRVLDVVNPFHFREFTLGDFADQRIPLWSAQLELPLGDNATAQLVWVPDHTYNDVPTTGRFAFTSPRVVPQVPAGFAGTVEVDAAERPQRAFQDDDFGVRLAAFVGGWDLTLNYLYAYDDAAVFRRSGTGTGIRLTPTYERTHMLGGTFANAFGSFTVRGELGYFSQRHFLTSSLADADGVFASAEYSQVIGLDYSTGDWLLSTQWFQRRILDSQAGATSRSVDNTSSALAQYSFDNENAKIRVLYLYGWQDHDSMTQVDFTYGLSTDITMKLGADVFVGEKSGLFGQFGETDRVRLGVEIGL